MAGTVVVLVNGEVLANGQGSKIPDQRLNAKALAEGLYPLLSSDLQVAVMHGNKPQVGFVLFRAELASHALHTIPLDVCGADTQGATGYMLSQAFNNVLEQHKISRKVFCLVTRTLVDDRKIGDTVPFKAIGPLFDREKAEQYRQTRGWEIVEEPGRGYRRGVPSLPAMEVLEIEGIQKLIEDGNIVIAGGGGGIPVVRSEHGDLIGIEAVVETEQSACLLAQQLHANVLLMVIEKDNQFILSGLSTERANHLNLDELDRIINRESLRSSSVERKLKAASDFLHGGGEQVVITTLRGLPGALSRKSGLRIGAPVPTLEMFQVF